MIQSSFSMYQNCTLCPRHCKVDRTKTTGFCRETADLSIDASLLHHGEEPCISFKRGSGTIFFTGCSLRCPFCQNMQISRKSDQRKFYTLDQFVLEIEKLISMGAENINFVTPDHFAPHLIEAIKVIKSKGHQIPFIYNCSGYQSLSHLEMVMDYIDVFLLDYKFAIPELSRKIYQLPDYPEVCEQALSFIYKNKGNLKLDESGKALSGVLIRHLVMPDMIENSLKVFNNLFVDYGNKIYFSLMSQYSPKYLVNGFEFLNKRVTKNEYGQVITLIEELGFSNGYIQEFIDCDDEFLPDFKSEQVFKT